MRIHKQPVRFLGGVGAYEHRLYWNKVPNSVDYTSQYSVIDEAPDGNGYVNFDLGDYMSGAEGLYNIGITSLDSFENESGMATKYDVDLDFLPPAAPGLLEFL